MSYNKNNDISIDFAEWITINAIPSIEEKTVNGWVLNDEAPIKVYSTKKLFEIFINERTEKI